MSTITRAKDALQRFVEWRAQGRIIQCDWHTEDDKGREVACALGMLGEGVNNPSDCPASIMPQWLAECVPTLFDAGPLSGALEWGQRFYTALARLDGKVPDSVRTDWLCDHVWPMAKSALRGEWIEKIDPFIDERIAAERSGDTDRIRAARVAADAAAANAYAAAHVAAAAATNAYAYAVAAADAAADAASCAAADAAAAAATDAYAVAAAYVAADADAHAATNAYVAADAVANANADAAAVAYAATNAYADAAAVAAAHAAAKLKLRNALVECMERAT